jgi:hypothetical protein
MIDGKNQEDLDRDEHDEAFAICLHLQQQNDAALQGLAREGVQVHHDSLTSARLAVLLDTVLGPLGKTADETTTPRVAYELMCQQRFAEMIEEVQKRIRLQRLTAGVNAAMPTVQNNGNGSGLIH